LYDARTFKVIFWTRKNQPQKFLSDATFGADPVTGKFVLLGEEASPVRRQLLVTVGKNEENMLFPGPVIVILISMFRFESL
jgi:hypothetical protein